MSFEAFDVRGNNPGAAQRASSRRRFPGRVLKFADYDPDGWLILTGDTGVGKTHLAVAIYGRQTERGQRSCLLVRAGT